METHENGMSVCACGVITPPVRLESATGQISYRCPECMTESPASPYEEDAKVFWENTVAELKRENPETCCRCGVPIFPGGFIQQGTDLAYCDVCAEDMFGI